MRDFKILQGMRCGFPRAAFTKLCAVLLSKVRCEVAHPAHRSLKCKAQSRKGMANKTKNKLQEVRKVFLGAQVAGVQAVKE
jgi:hypothetical protein